MKKVLDWAAELGCPYIDVWPGQDGYDYAFQADYLEAWKWLRDGLVACAEHNDKVRILVEYKLKEPRTHCFVNSAAKVLLLLAGLDKVGVLLDVGHAMAAGENAAEAAALLASHGKLDYLHLNDNYHSWDDDMMVGSVHLVEYLELAYWLKRVDYKGWLTLDIFPYREDGVRAATECREWMEAFFKAVDRAGMEPIAEVIRQADGCTASQLVRAPSTFDRDFSCLPYQPEAQAATQSPALACAWSYDGRGMLYPGHERSLEMNETSGPDNLVAQTWANGGNLTA